MTHRERVLSALRRQAPDRVPLDFGSSIASTITAPALGRLREHLGVDRSVPPAVFSKRSTTVIPDAALLERFRTDLRPVLLGESQACPDRALSPRAFVDEWGITWTRPEEGHYIASEGPFHRLDEPALSDLEKYSGPDPADPGRVRGLRERARELHDQTEYAAVLNLGVGPVHLCQFLRGYGEWLEDLLVRPVFAEGLLERVTDFWIEVSRRALEEAGEHIDVVWFGDDVGTQRATLVRPELYRRVIKPQHRRMVAALKPCGRPIAYHSCGSVYPLIPDLIEIGIDALNPVQVSAAAMDSRRLKQEFGRDLAFWGAIDTHRVLPFGSPPDVREEVKRRIGDLAQNGGYILSAVHNIQAGVPPENVVAMYEAGWEFGERGS